MLDGFGLLIVVCCAGAVTMVVLFLVCFDAGVLCWHGCSLVWWCVCFVVLLLGMFGFGACGYLVYLLFVTDCVDFWSVSV